MFDQILETRTLQCETCENKCEYHLSEQLKENCFKCPLNKFNKFDCPDHKLGNAIETITKPIAKLIDYTSQLLPEKYHTDIQHCKACEARKEFLNNLKF